MIDVGQCNSVFDAFEQAASAFPDRVFLRAPASSTKAYADDAVEYTYEQTRRAVAELAQGYADSNVALGDRVAVAFDSRLDVYLHLLALNALGASIVPLMSAASDDEILYIVTHSDAKTIVVLPEYLERFREIGRRAGGREVISVNDVRASNAVRLPSDRAHC